MTEERKPSRNRLLTEREMTENFIDFVKTTAAELGIPEHVVLAKTAAAFGCPVKIVKDGPAL